MSSDRTGTFCGRTDSTLRTMTPLSKHARQFVNGYDIELWSGARLVGKLKPPSNER
jgi:hypothetical protein